MAILDILNRSESEFFSKVFKLEIDYFNRDLALLLNNKVNVVQPSYDYLPQDKTIENMQSKFIRIYSAWEGDCSGQSSIVFKMDDAKIMCGLLMMLSPDDIKETLADPFSADEEEIFKEIANQVNGSLDNALRENFKFDFHSSLIGVDVVNSAESNLKELMPEEGYMSISAIMKFKGFPDSVICQYVPKALVEQISKTQGIDEGGGEKEDEDDQKKILVVDDDPVIRKIIRGFLKGEEFNMLEASDGVEAMQMLIRSNVNLVIMDIEMPNMNGIEACKRIKQNPRTKNIPVVMCSSKSSRDNVMNAVNSGARDFLVKPINKKEEFIGRISKHIS